MNIFMLKLPHYKAAFSKFLVPIVPAFVYLRFSDVHRNDTTED